MLLHASLHYASRLSEPGGASVSWIGGAAGLGVRAPLASFAALEARASFVVERLQVTAFDPMTSAVGETGRFVAGGRLGATALIGSPRVAFVAGLEASAVGGTTLVNVRGAPATTVSPLLVGGSAGVCLVIPDP